MDLLKLAILAFIAGGVVLYMANVSAVHAILISAVVMTIVTVIAVIRYKVDPPAKKPKPGGGNVGKGPTIQ